MEDDYYSEFCYDSRPLAALQGLDSQQWVIYLGTSLTMVLYPGIRLDYVILPPALVEPFLAARKTIDLHINRSCHTKGNYKYLNKVKHI
jgi:GntR family transcriptional regulator / MocR family aminotransferase